MARNSVKVGIIMLVAWLIPLFGLLLAIAGLTMGVNSYSLSRRDMARAGIFLNSLGIGLSLINISVGLYFILSGVIEPLGLINQQN
ncbi:MAG: hypothetical protein ACQESO_03390 [Bacillota bacterium]